MIKNKNFFKIICTFCTILSVSTVSIFYILNGKLNPNSKSNSKSSQLVFRSSLNRQLIPNSVNFNPHLKGLHSWDLYYPKINTLYSSEAISPLIIPFPNLEDVNSTYNWVYYGNNKKEKIADRINGKYIVRTFNSKSVVNKLIEPVHIILTVKDRKEALENFLNNINLIRQFKLNLSVHLAIFDNLQLPNKYQNTTAFNWITTYRLSGNHSRSNGIDYIARKLSGNPIIFIADVDINVNREAIYRLIANSADRLTVFLPIVWSLYNPQLAPNHLSKKFEISEHEGYWRRYGYGIMGMRLATFKYLDYYNWSNRGWGGEDTHFMEKARDDNTVTVFRAVENGIVHNWHDKDCTGLTGTHHVYCQWSRAQNEGTVRQLGMYKYKIEESTFPKIHVYKLPQKFRNGVIAYNKKNPPKIRDPDCTKNFYSAEVSIANYLDKHSVSPEEADLFYLPIYPSCVLINGHPPNFNLTAKYIREAVNYIRKNYNHYFTRNNGSDHIMALTSGPGFHLSGNNREISRFINLVHNGDLSENSFKLGHDIVIPPDLNGYPFTPGFEYTNKRWLAHFGGTVFKDKKYSQGIRQYIVNNFKNRTEFRITGTRIESYYRDIAGSKFCLCPEGWYVWTPRPYISMQLGCIPVIISDKTVLAFNDLIPYHRFVYQFSPSKIAQLPQFLASIPDSEIVKRKREMRKWWPYVSYHPEKGRVFYALEYALGRRKANYNLI